jgi:glycerate 2-kinase
MGSRELSSVMASSTQFAAMRQCARDIFIHALQESSVSKALGRYVEASRGVLRIGDDLYGLDELSRIYAVSFGKAAHVMARHLREQLGTAVNGILSAPPSNEPMVEGLRYFHGSHPEPNGESLKAADAILKALGTMSSTSLVIYLISGGGSAMVEKPIDDEISLDELAQTHRLLVNTGAAIQEVNAIRKHLSAVKGGRMAQAAARNGAKQVSVMVSDVPDDALDALASGPTMPDSTEVDDCYRIAEKYNLVERFPASVRELFDRKALLETPDRDDPLFYHSRWWPILRNQDALSAAAAKASELGFAVEIDHQCDGWEYDRAAEHLLQRLRQLRGGASRVCLLSGGEVGIRLPENAGRGGRNQQFALYCAKQITSENITVLSAGTDGIDGNSPAAGAVADGETTLRHSALESGPSLSVALEGFDANPFFETLGDTIVTGPTGNNIRDVRVLLAY